MSERKSVLLVDDDRNINQAVNIRLSAAGYDVFCEFAGAAGVAAARARRPDAIILDVRMAGMNGLEVLDVLQSRAETRDIPVLMLSASLWDEQTAIARGARYFLQKPIDVKMLYCALDRVLAKPRRADS